MTAIRAPPESALQIRAASTRAMALGRIYMADSENVRRWCVERHTVLQSDCCPLFRWMPWVCELIGPGKLAQVCLRPRTWISKQAHDLDFPCFGHLQGTLNQVDRPAQACRSCGLQGQCTSQAAFFWLNVHIFGHMYAGGVVV